METSKLTIEKIRELVKKAKEVGTDETKYLLFIGTQNRPGTSFMEIEDFEILHGEAEVVELGRYYNYPHFNTADYMLIPKTIPTVVRWWRKWDFGPNDYGYEEVIYVFTEDGWKEVEVQNTRR